MLELPQWETNTATNTQLASPSTNIKYSAYLFDIDIGYIRQTV